LLHQPLRGWLADRLKAALVGGGLAFGAVEVIYGLIAATPLWWLLAAGIFAVVQIGLAVIFPIWLLPLFYRLAPLTDDALSRRLLGLARRAGVAVIGVWVADQSRKSRTANAALGGSGARAGSSSSTPWWASSRLTKSRACWRTSWPTTSTATPGVGWWCRRA
jgi:hypothetical protein